MSNIRQKLLDIPKSEIHLHLEGLASCETIWALKKKHKLSFDNIKTIQDLEKAFQVSSLDEFLSLFINVIQKSFQEEDDIKFLIEDAKNYLTRNNIYYAEIFFAPSKFIQMGLSFEKLMDILDNGAQEIYKEKNITIKYLIDVSRTFGIENANRNLDLLLKYKRKSIIGIGLGGAENKGPAADYVEVYERAIKAKLKVVAHAGEVLGPKSIWDSINLLKAERIGHGISAIQDKELIKTLIERKIPLEVCPTSNFFTKTYTTDYSNHPVRALYDAGVTITINTDDPTIFGVELIEEYARLIENNLFTMEEIVQLIKNNLFSTFLSDELKEQIWKNIQKEIKLIK